MKIVRSLLYILFINTLLSATIVAQSYVQTVRGTIVDEDSKLPLIGVNVVIAGSNPLMGTTTDPKGEFRLDSVPFGRINLLVSYLGYEKKYIPNIIVGSAKEVVLRVELKESLSKIDEVTIKARKNNGEVLNKMALVSGHSFSVDETKRYAGSFQDPSRMVSAYAGVTGDPSGNNDIVVRGNSPKGILWRLDGIEIPNPNHFSDEGSTGGPINALNSELLSNSDFYTGAFAPEYGNVLSGVFDLKMRTGNNEKRESSVGIGALGTDAMFEGPFKKNYEGSYLVNYRYSSVALLNSLGLVNFYGVPKYQDGAFKLQLPTKKWGTFSIFGFGGSSHIYESDTESPESTKVIEKTDYGAHMGFIAVKNTLSLNANSFLKLSLSLSNNGSHYYDEQPDSSGLFTFFGKGNWDKNSLRAKLYYSWKISARNRIVAGANYVQFYYNMHENYFNRDLNRLVNAISLYKNAGMTQGFVSWKYRVNDNTTFVGGVHGLYFALNHELSIEPRAAFRWQFAPKHAFNIGFGLHSKAESIITYYNKAVLPNGQVVTPNTHLGLSKAYHVVAGYSYQITNNMNAKIEAYYQYLYDIPVENNDSSTYSILNSDDGYEEVPLSNDGTGRNYGIEFTLNHYFVKNFYYLLTASLYDSKYTAKDGITRNTKYDGNYVFNFLIGKEFIIGKRAKANTFGTNIKFFYCGGRRYIPINLPASVAKGEAVYDYAHAWEHRLDDIKQINLSVSYRLNRPKTSHEFIIDIINLTGAQARTSEYYNKYTHQIAYDRQFNFLPNIIYRIHF